MRQYRAIFFLVMLILTVGTGCSQRCNQQKCGQDTSISNLQNPLPSNSRAFGSSQDVRIVTAEPDPRVCEYISDAMGHSLDRDLSRAQSTSRNMLKQQAASMGGNIVRLDTNTVDDPGLLERGQVVLNGRVFKCDLTLNPSDILGKIQRTSSTPTPGSTPPTQQSSPGSPSADPSERVGLNSQSPSSVNPPSSPTPAFNEQAFLDAGEGEFEG